MACQDGPQGAEVDWTLISLELNSELAAFWAKTGLKRANLKSASLLPEIMEEAKTFLRPSNVTCSTATK